MTGFIFNSSRSTITLIEVISRICLSGRRFCTISGVFGEITNWPVLPYLNSAAHIGSFSNTGRKTCIYVGERGSPVGKGNQKVTQIFLECGAITAAVWYRKKLLSHLMTKPTKWHERPAKTQINMGILPVWSEFSLSHGGSLDSTLSYTVSAQRRLWSDWASAQADLSLH